MEVALFFGMLFVLMGGQILGTRLQVKSFNESMKKLHKKGNVGVGSKKRKVGAGYVILIACDKTGIITGAELMKGLTVFNRFKPYNELNGRSVYDVNSHFKGFGKYKKDEYSGYIQALDALEAKLAETAAGKEVNA